jgi:hypothetical protein
VGGGAGGGAVVWALGSGSPRALVAATGLGVASSSCSYAAVALARSLFCKGASFLAVNVAKRQRPVGKNVVIRHRGCS